PDVELSVHRLEDERPPTRWQLAARGRDPDQQRVRVSRDAVRERAKNRYVAPKPEYVLGRPTHLRRVDDADDTLRCVANAGVSCLRPKGAERTLGEDEKTQIHGARSGAALERRVLGDCDDVNRRTGGDEHAAAGSGESEDKRPLARCAA